MSAVKHIRMRQMGVSVGVTLTSQDSKGDGSSGFLKYRLRLHVTQSGRVALVDGGDAVADVQQAFASASDRHLKKVKMKKISTIRRLSSKWERESFPNETLGLTQQS